MSVWTESEPVVGLSEQAACGSSDISWLGTNIGEWERAGGGRYRPRCVCPTLSVLFWLVIGPDEVLGFACRRHR